MWRSKQWVWRVGGYPIDLPGDHREMPRLEIKTHVQNPLKWSWKRKPYVSDHAFNLHTHPKDYGPRQVGLEVRGIVLYAERSTGGGTYSSTIRSHTKRHYSLKIGIANLDITVKLSAPLWDRGREETLFARDLWVRKNAAVDHALAAHGCTHERRSGPSSSSRRPLYEEPIQVGSDVQLREYTGSYHCWECPGTTGADYLFTKDFMAFLNSSVEYPVELPTHVETHVLPRIKIKEATSA